MASETIHKNVVIAALRKPSGRHVKAPVLRTATSKSTVKIKFQYETSIDIVILIIKKNLETIPGIHLIDSLQKTAVLGTSHIIRKVLQCEA